MIKLILIGSLLLFSLYFFNVQINVNDNVTIIMSLSIQVILIATGVILRNKFLKPDFRKAYDLAIKYHQYKITDSNYKSKLYQIFGSIFGILVLPIMFGNIFSNIANIEVFGNIMIIFIYFASIIIGIFIYPNISFDRGKITKEKIFLEQSNSGNIFSVDIDIQEIDQIGIYLVPIIFLVPENIILTFSLNNDYFYQVNVDPSENEAVMDQIVKLHNWFVNNLKVKSTIYKNHEEWNDEWENKIEIKRWI